MRNHYFAPHEFFYGDGFNNFMELGRERETEKFSIQKCDFKIGLKLTGVNSLIKDMHARIN